MISVEEFILVGGLAYPFSLTFINANFDINLNLKKNVQ